MLDHIGKVKINNPFVLPPLAGITDAPFRRICSEMGASLTCSEMVSVKGLYYKDKNTDKLLTILQGEGKVSYQLFGHEPEIFREVVPTLEDRENSIIDLNLGCPVPKIVKNGEGSALLKNPSLVYDIVKAIKDSTSKEVTCKMRIGFDDKTINYLEVADAIFSAGASAITLHCRTREAYYSGKANWNHIAILKDKFPDKVIIGNGDVIDVRGALRMLDETGCDMVAIGRGSLGNPWLFKELKMVYEGLTIEKGNLLLQYEEGLKNDVFSPSEANLSDRKNMILRHLNDEAMLKGDSTAVKEMRKHIGWYFKGIKGSARLRGELNSINDINELRMRIECL